MIDVNENLRFIYCCFFIINFVISLKNLDVWYKLIWFKKNYIDRFVFYIYSEF